MSEAEVQREILKRWGSHPKVRLWRTNAGRAYAETSTGFRPIAVNIPGLGDLTGWMMVDVPDEVWWRRILSVLLGEKRYVAVFLTIEVKSETGRMRESQLVFRAQLLKMGGLHIVARSVADVDRILGPLTKEEGKDARHV